VEWVRKEEQRRGSAKGSVYGMGKEERRVGGHQGDRRRAIEEGSTIDLRGRGKKNEPESPVDDVPRVWTVL